MKPLPGWAIVIIGLVLFGAIVASAYGKDTISQAQANVVIIQPSPTIQNWITYHISLYHASISLPPGWTIAEKNRRFDPYSTTECANYLFSSSDGSSKIIVTNFCGTGDWFPGPCPEDTEIVVSSEPNSIVRFFDKDQSAYTYTLMRNITIDNEIEIVCDFDPITYFGKNQFANIRFRFFGKPSEKEKAIETADKIIASIREDK